MKLAFFTSFVRSLARHRFYAALNIGGLAVGVAVFLVLLLFVRFELSFERWMPNHDEVYLIQSAWNVPDSPINGNYFQTMGGLLEHLRDDFPALVGTRIRGGKNGGAVQVDGRAVRDNVAQVDGTFFDVFDLPMAAGSSVGALKDPNSVVISESAARRYFGEKNPIGENLSVSLDELKTYRVASVFRDLPDNSDLVVDVLIPLPRTLNDPNWFNWGGASLMTFVRFDSPDAARQFEGKLPNFIDRRARTALGENASQLLGLKLLALAAMHLTPEGQTTASRKITVITLSIVGLATLLIAIVNYINLATARVSLRAREVAIRKVVGADHATLRRQFLVESMLTVACAALLGLILTELSLPFINAQAGTTLSIPYFEALLVLAGVVIAAGVLAGIYPAVLLSKYEPAAVLMSSRSPSGGKTGALLREVLVVAQFGIATAFLIATTVIIAQINHVRNADLGFDRNGLVTVLSLRDSLIDPAQKRAYVEAVKGIPGVIAVTYANSAVGGSGQDNADNVAVPGVPGDGPSLRWEMVGPDFFDVYKTRVLAGRVFGDSFGADDFALRPEGSAAKIVINRDAVRALRFASAEDAVGKTVGGDRPRTIIGVVENMRFASPREPVAPTYYFYTRDLETIGNTVLSVRYQIGSYDVLSQLEASWQQTIPQVPFDAATAQERLREFYRDDDRASQLFGAGAVLAILIGCVGLWGLASFNTSRRVHEIGIRKTLGASSNDIVRLLVGQFLKPVLIANLIAWPLAYYATSSWLAGFDDRIWMSPMFFLIASLLALGIALATVIGQSLRASRAAPSWALRHE
jgi:putative ABC transport system permease protein